MLNPLDIAKESYHEEMQRLEHLRRAIPFVSGSIVSISVGLFYFAEKISNCFEFGLFVKVAIAICILCLVVSGALLIYGDLRYRVAFMNRPDQIESYREELSAYDDEKSNELFEKFIAARYREAASTNGIRNRVRGASFFYSKVFVVIAIVPFLFVVSYYTYYQVFAEGAAQCR